LPKNAKVEWQLILYNKNNDLTIHTDEEELELELELDNIIENENNIKYDKKRDLIEYKLEEIYNDVYETKTYGIRKSNIFHIISSINLKSKGIKYN